MTKHSYRISSSSGSGFWQWQVYQEKPRKLVRWGSEKEKNEAEVAARKTMAELATDNNISRKRSLEAAKRVYDHARPIARLSGPDGIVAEISDAGLFPVAPVAQSGSD